jgi:hypothetical protein
LLYCTVVAHTYRVASTKEGSESTMIKKVHTQEERVLVSCVVVLDDRLVTNDHDEVVNRRVVVLQTCISQFAAISNDNDGKASWKQRTHACAQMHRE